MAASARRVTGLRTTVHRRTQAQCATGLAMAAIAAPAAVQALTGTRVSAREILSVELAGSGERILEVAQGSPERLEVYRSLLGLRDNVYVCVYCVPLLVATDLLPVVARRVGTTLVLATAVADVVENAMLERSLATLATDTSNPGRVDDEARLARHAAWAKFAALAPSIGFATWGIHRSWRR